MRNVIAYFILLNILLDAFSFFFPTGGLTAILRLVLVFGTFFLFLVQNRIYGNHWFIFPFIVYSILQLFFARDFYYSTRVTLQIVTPFIGYIIGYSSVNFLFVTPKYFLKQFGFIYITIAVYSIIAIVFDIGSSTYSVDDEFTVGGFRDAYNSWTYSLILFPFVLLDKSMRGIKKVIVILAALTVLVLLLISLKRIAIAGLIIGVGLYFIYDNNKFVNVIWIIIIGCILYLSYPYYGSLLESRIEARKQKGRFEEKFYETEARYLETRLIIENIYGFKDPRESLFGFKAFDSRGAFDGAFGQTRQLHVDYNQIVYTTGIVGLAFYLLIYIGIFARYLELKRFFGRINLRIPQVKYLNLIPILLISSLITSIAGQMYNISFRLIIFMTIGVVTSYFVFISKHLMRYRIVKKV